MIPKWHYERAEGLLAEGQAVVRFIGELNDERNGCNLGTDDGFERWRDITRQMDEFGKKAMGIWAQAQAHATLATVPHGLGVG